MIVLEHHPDTFLELPSVVKLMLAAHTHGGQDKIYYVVEGTGRFKVGEEEKELGPGHIVLAPAGTNHGVANRGQQRLVTLVFVTPRPSH